MSTEIQAVLVISDGLTGRNYHYKRVNGVISKISKAKWFELYDLSDTIVLPPITKE